MDGVLTDDNDAFLYGAQTVYCDLCASEKACNAENSLIHNSSCIHFYPCNGSLKLGAFNVYVFHEQSPPDNRFGLSKTVLPCWNTDIVVFFAFNLQD